MNIVNIIGNLTKDPELRYTTGAEPKAVCKFTVAVNEGHGDNQRTSFLPVTVWGRTAENCEKYLKKGSKVAVTGRLQTGSYEKDGVKHYTTDIVASPYGIEFLTSKGNSQPAGMTTADGVPAGFSAVPDDELPEWM